MKQQDAAPSSDRSVSSSFAQLHTTDHTNSTVPGSSFLSQLPPASVFLQNPAAGPAVDADAVATSQKEDELLRQEDQVSFPPMKVKDATSTATVTPPALLLPGPAPLETLTSEPMLDVDQKQQQNASQPKSAGTRPSSVLLQTDTDDQKPSSTSFLQGEQNTKTSNPRTDHNLNEPPGGDRRLVDVPEKSNPDDHTTTTSVGTRNPRAPPALLPQEHEDAPSDPLHPTFSAGRREGSTTTSNAGAFTQLQTGAVHTQQEPATQQMTRQNATAGGSSVLHDDLIREHSAPAAAFSEHEEQAFSKSREK